VNDASTPEMEKAEAEEPKEATQTEVVEIAAPKSQSTEVTAARMRRNQQILLMTKQSMEVENMMSNLNVTEPVTRSVQHQMTEEEQ
jgi:hypothetical protein